MPVIETDVLFSTYTYETQYAAISLLIYVFELRLGHINRYFSDIDDIAVVRLTTLKLLEK